MKAQIDKLQEMMRLAKAATINAEDLPISREELGEFLRPLTSSSDEAKAAMRKLGMNE